MLRQKKLFRATALFLALYLPASQAFAVWPVLLGLSGAEQAALGGSVALHAAVAAIAIKNHESDSSPVLTVNLSPKAPTTSGVPAGWAACGSTASDGYPCPPSSVPKTYQYTTAAGTQEQANSCQGGQMNAAHATPQLACDAMTCMFRVNGWTNANGTVSGERCTVVNNTTTLYNQNLPKTSTCPAGYTDNGTSCSLNNASLVPLPNDGIKYVPRVGNAFIPSARDTDPTPNGVTYPDANTVSYNDPVTGESVVIHLDSSTGAGQVTYTKPSSDGSVTTKDVIDFSPPDANGEVTVTGKGRATFQGTGSQISQTPNQTTTITNTCGTPGNAPCKIDETGTPSSFTGTQGAALDAKFDELTVTINSQTGGVGQGLGLASVLNNIPEGCVNPTFDADIGGGKGGTYTIPVCETAAKWQPYERFATWLFTSIAIWGLWFRRMGGA